MLIPEKLTQDKTFSWGIQNTQGRHQVIGKTRIQIRAIRRIIGWYEYV